MKNKGLLTRSDSSPLGTHKLDDANAKSPSSSASTPERHPAIKPSLHQPVTITPDPDGARYTLTLKLEKSVADIIARACGTADLGVQSGAKRALTLQFRANLLNTPIEKAAKAKINVPASLRLDIRLPEAFVLQILAIEQAAPFEPRATTLARNLAPRLAQFLKTSVSEP